jgi:hypothetical protein
LNAPYILQITLFCFLVFLYSPLRAQKTFNECIRFVAGDLVRLIDAAQLFAIARKNNRNGGSNNHSGLVWADIQAALVDVRPSELTELDVRRFPTREQGGPSWDDFGGCEDGNFPFLALYDLVLVLLLH